MDFNSSKPIYQQIGDRICDEILQEKLSEGERIPSIREYASIVEVNLNTVMRTFEYLQLSNIIFNKRGIGYFVSEGARQMIHTLRKKQFMENEVENFFRQLYLLKIPFADIEAMYNNYINQQENH